MLSGITLTCFAASYAVTFACEAARMLMRGPWLKYVAWVFAVAGLFAHSTYLVLLAREDIGAGTVFSSWYSWCLLAAWVLACATLGLAVRRPQSAVGLFMMPAVLLLVAAAWLLQDATPFAQAEAISIWGIVHGVALLFGTVGVFIAFVTGVMYLIQSYRLKHKLPPSKTFRLPNLEWLQRISEESLVISSVLLAVGLISGTILNLIRHANDSAVVAWTEPAVWSSALLLSWLVGAMVFNWLYKPARQGRKVAYLTFAHFGFLIIVLVLVLSSEHAADERVSIRRSYAGQHALGERSYGRSGLHQIAKTEDRKPKTQAGGAA